MSSAQLHPEFGYFCPSLRVRRVLRAALVLAFFGLIAGAGGIRPFVSHDDDIDNRVMPAHANPAGGNERLVQADGPPRPEARPQPTRATVGKVDTPRSDPAKMCEEMTWAYLDGKCVAGKARKPRVVRVPTHRPAIALIPLGRNSAASADAGASTPAAARVPDSAEGKPASLKSPQSAPGDAVSAQASDPALQAFATSKKPQRTAQNRTQRRNKSASNDLWWRENRADHWGWRGRPGYADARASGREGFSGWSW